MHLFSYCECFLYVAIDIDLDCMRMQGGHTALIFAARRGHTDCVRLLLDRGAYADFQNNVRQYIYTYT